MTKLQWILFGILMLTMVVLVIVFWGSIASALMAFCIIMSLSMLLRNKFINADRDNDFSDSENG